MELMFSLDITFKRRRRRRDSFESKVAEAVENCLDDLCLIFIGATHFYTSYVLIIKHG